jgi:hypothetical protein
MLIMEANARLCVLSFTPSDPNSLPVTFLFFSTGVSIPLLFSFCCCCCGIPRPHPALRALGVAISHKSKEHATTIKLSQRAQQLTANDFCTNPRASKNQHNVMFCKISLPLAIKLSHLPSAMFKQA